MHAIDRLEQELRRLHRRAERLQFDPFGEDLCTDCGRVAEVNIRSLCESCCYRQKLATLKIVAVPWALAQVRREHGISGETDRASEEKKVRHDEHDRSLGYAV